MRKGEGGDKFVGIVERVVVGRKSLDIGGIKRLDCLFHFLTLSSCNLPEKRGCRACQWV